MYRNSDYRVEIEIDLENGVYVFDDKSATGKTRLAKELRNLNAFGEDVMSYTFNDIALGRDLKSELLKRPYKVIILDRYDMYNGLGAAEIDSLSDKSIILIDCKSMNGPKIETEYGYCDIEMTADKIEVIS